MFSDTDKNDTLSLHELSTVFQLVDETFQNILEEEESEKVVKDKESVRDFIRFWFLLADSDENDELSLQEISSIIDIFAECVQYPSIFFNVVQCVQYGSCSTGFKNLESRRDCLQMTSPPFWQF